MMHGRNPVVGVFRTFLSSVPSSSCASALPICTLPSSSEPIASASSGCSSAISIFCKRRAFGGAKHFPFSCANIRLDVQQQTLTISFGNTSAFGTGTSGICGPALASGICRPAYASVTALLYKHLDLR
jgi:hypothetical protein